jgi:hypothetical protein
MSVESVAPAEHLGFFKIEVKSRKALLCGVEPAEPVCRLNFLGLKKAM